MAVGNCLEAASLGDGWVRPWSNNVWEGLRPGPRLWAGIRNTPQPANKEPRTGQPHESPASASRARG